MSLRLGSLFSGYGGLEMGVASVLDVNTVWVSDVLEPACKVLAYRYPDAPNLGDITTIDWSTVPPIDVLTGGWPCQPFSLAGKRKGSADARALWPYVADAVRHLRPRLVVLENVAAIASAGELARATADLAALGYVGSWRCVRASDVGAAHQRARIFIVATDTDSTGPEGTESTGRRHVSARRVVADTTGVGSSERRPEPAGLVGGPDAHVGGTATPADTQDVGHERGRFARGWRDGSTDSSDTAPDTDRRGPQGIGRIDTVGRDTHRRDHSDTAWGKYEPAIRRWERLTRPAPPPAIPNKRGTMRLSGRFDEWHMGLPDGWVTDVPGVSNNDALKLCGNGVVPQQAAAAVAAILSERVAA